MKNLEPIAQDLFAKIRGRFPEVTLGNEEGNVTSEPKQARFFEFPFKGSEKELGKITVSLDEENGVTVMYSTDVVEGETEITKNEWYEFLKELRKFSKKRMLNFNTRNINKSNLEKRDYQYLAKATFGETQMTESKLYGTARVSYQNVGEARIMIKHTESINQETAIGRTQKIGSIYIESAEGERFKYPYKHLSGARAMARHVAEGGKPFDDFGTHITGLSEEMSKLRKFKSYMGRSAVMAESLAEYTDVVKERIATVKKTIESLQKPAYYAETVAAFEKPMFEDVPDDVKENWIDQLTIKQFNEELADVFPYIYKLVGEATRAKELGPDELDEVAGPDKCWDGYKKDGTKPGTGKNKGKRVNNCVPEEIALEQGFEEMMGQFSEATNDCDETCPKSCPDCGGTGDPKKYQAQQNEADLDEAYINNAKDAINTLGALRKIGKSIERGQDTYDGNLAGMYANDVWDVINWLENNADTQDPSFKKIIEPVLALRKKAKGMEREPGSGKDARFGNEIVNALYPLMQWIETNASDAKEGNAYAHAVKQAKMDGKKKGDKVKGPDGDEITLEKDKKTPLGEFILSYFDYTTGQFPKGETAILTMVEKDYGEQFIDPAKQFIEKINNRVSEVMGYRAEPGIEENPELDRVSKLAGLR